MDESLQVTARDNVQLAAASLFLVFACAIAVPLMQADQRYRKVKDRIERFAAPYARATVIDAREPRAVLVPSTAERIVMKILTGLIGFVPSHKQHFPLAWWIVVPTALVLARLMLAFVPKRVRRVRAPGLFRLSGRCSRANSIAGASRSASGFCSSSSRTRWRCWYVRCALVFRSPKACAAWRPTALNPPAGSLPRWPIRSLSA